MWYDKSTKQSDWNDEEGGIFMNQLKKTIAALTAFVSVVCTSALTANASIIEPWQFTCTEGENGTAIVTTYNRDYGFLVVTDGTELETFEHNGNLNQPLRTMEELPSIPQEWDWEMGCDDLVGQYDDTNRYYHVDLNCSAGWENLSAIARDFMLEHDGVVDVILLEHAYSGTPEWYGDFEIYYRDDATDAEITAFRENADKSVLHEVQADYADTENVPDYEMLSRSFAACEAFLTQNAEFASCVDFVQPSLLISGDGKVVYAGGSAWEGIGDTDGNAVIDAADASKILEMASVVGSGVQTAVNESEDVNADGNVNAIDAAAVLCYAAAQGSGDPLSWLDILRK